MLLWSLNELRPPPLICQRGNQIKINKILIHLYSTPIVLFHFFPFFIHYIVLSSAFLAGFPRKSHFCPLAMEQIFVAAPLPNTLSKARLFLNIA